MVQNWMVFSWNFLLRIFFLSMYFTMDLLLIASLDLVYFSTVMDYFCVCSFLTTGKSKLLCIVQWGRGLTKAS